MIDPMSQNPVPPGAMPSEVRDDVPINASEGEYVLPADVVRYIGLDKIEKMVNQAKKGMEEMGQEGRIGGEELVPMSSEPAPMPQEAPMFNTGGLVQGAAPQTGPFNERRIGFAFDPRPHIPGQSPREPPETKDVYKRFIGPNGQIVYIPFDSSGNPTIPIPEGYVDANEAPSTFEEMRQNTARDSMWSDGLTPEQIRQERENRTFRTQEEINPRVTPGEGGSFGEFVLGIGERVSQALGKLTSGEGMGALGTLIGTFAGQPALGRVVGMAVDKINEKRKEEGLGELPAEELVEQAAPNANLSQDEKIEVTNNAKKSPSNIRTQANVSEKATEEGAIDLSKHTVIGIMGAPDSQRIMVMDPEAGVIYVEEGQEIGETGAVFEGFKEGLSEDSIVGKPLSEVSKLKGDLPSFEPPSLPSDNLEAAFSGDIGFDLSTPTAGRPQPRPTGLMDRPSSSPSSSQQPRGLSPKSPSLSFSDQREVGRDRSDHTSRTSSTAGARTSSGGAVTGPSAGSGYSQGQQNVGRTGTGGGSVASRNVDRYGSTSPSGGGRGVNTPGGYSTGEPVERSTPRSSYDERNPRGFAKGGLVDSPYRNYDITKGYSKGGLVKRNK